MSLLGPLGPLYDTYHGSGGEVHHPTVLHSVNLSQASGHLHQRRVRDRVSNWVRVRDRVKVRNRVRDRDRLSLGGELLHQRHLPYTPCPEKRGHSFFCITSTNVVSTFLARTILSTRFTQKIENLFVILSRRYVVMT